LITCGQSQGADEFRLAGVFIFGDDTQAAILAKVQNQFGQLVILDTGLHEVWQGRFGSDAAAAFITPVLMSPAESK